MLKAEVEQKLRTAQVVNERLKNEVSGLKSDIDYLKESEGRMLRNLNRVKEQANQRGDVIKHLVETYHTWHYKM